MGELPLGGCNCQRRGDNKMKRRGAGRILGYINFKKETQRRDLQASKNG